MLSYSLLNVTCMSEGPAVHHRTWFPSRLSKQLWLLHRWWLACWVFYDIHCWHFELLAAQYLSTIQGHGVKTLICVQSNGQGHIGRCGQAVKQPKRWSRSFDSGCSHDYGTYGSDQSCLSIGRGFHCIPYLASVYPLLAAYHLNL